MRLEHIEHVKRDNTTMELLRGEDGWYWRYHHPNPDPDPVGPFETRDEAVTEFEDWGVALDELEPCEPDDGYDETAIKHSSMPIPTQSAQNRLSSNWPILRCMGALGIRIRQIDRASGLVGAFRQ